MNVRPTMGGVNLWITVQEWPPMAVELFLSDELLQLCRDMKAVRNIARLQCDVTILGGRITGIDRTQIQEVEVPRE